MATRQFNPRVAVAERRRLQRFLIVGVSGTLLDFLLLIVLKSAGVPTLVANTLAFSAGIVNNFILNRWWTYSDARGKALGTRLSQFVAVSLVGLLVNTIALLAAEAAIEIVSGHAAWSYLPAKVIATAVSVVWNYIANRYWTFSDVR